MRQLVVLATVVSFGCLGLVSQNPARQGSGSERGIEGAASIRICPSDEPGERIVFTGRVIDYQGKPLSAAAVQAYNTGKDGLYVERSLGTRLPRIRGTALTDAAGRFRIETVMPGSYPGSTEPAHIHVSVLAPVHHVKFVGIWFEGDRFITAERRKEVERHDGADRDGETVIVKLEPGGDGLRTFHHEIQLVDN